MASYNRRRSLISMINNIASSPEMSSQFSVIFIVTLHNNQPHIVLTAYKKTGLYYSIFLPIIKNDPQTITTPYGAS